MRRENNLGEETYGIESFQKIDIYFDRRTNVTVHETFYNVSRGMVVFIDGSVCDSTCQSITDKTINNRHQPFA